MEKYLDQIIEFDDGQRYEGYLLQFKKNGIGILYGNEGDIIQGEYNENNGFGIEENPRVGKYEGDWLNNSIMGTGKMTYKNGCIYIGQFDKAKPSWFGKMSYPNGDIYICQFKNGPKEKGKYFYAEENGIFDSTWNVTEEKSIAKGIFYHYDGRQEKRTRIVELIDKNN